MRAGSRYSCSLGFVDNPWGEKACQLGRTTCRLDDTYWGMIKEHAYAHIGTAGDESDDGIAGFDDNASEAMNPHVLIELDW